MALVAFLVREVGVSVQAAIFGTWQWNEVLRQLHKSHSLGRGNDEVDELTQSTIFGMFNDIDEDGNGQIEHAELLRATVQDGPGRISKDGENADPLR